MYIKTTNNYNPSPPRSISPLLPPLSLFSRRLASPPSPIGAVAAYRTAIERYLFLLLGVLPISSSSSRSSGRGGGGEHRVFTDRGEEVPLSNSPVELPLPLPLPLPLSLSCTRLAAAKSSEAVKLPRRIWQGAIDYIVGDEDGWSTGVNYLLWSEKYNFTVGDSLVFNYVKGQHDVQRVTQDTYRSCDARSGVFDLYSSGRDRVNLTAEMSYWFICNVKGHCLGGMKFGISVGAARAEGGSGNSSNTNGAGLPPPPPPPPPGNGGAGDGTAWRRWLVLGLTFWVIQFLR
ncbi:uncharacterized protein [Typha latifolia]|uniref:uncharacterized protein isoform X1 n=1 Tax=Typha latifolia TaxID=4733 RepID=UPI003C3045A4